MLFLLCSCSNDSVKLPEDCPEFTSYGRSKTKGEYLTEMNGPFGFYLLKFDNKGDLIWYKKINDYQKERIGSVHHFCKSMNDNYYAFEMNTVDGEKYQEQLVFYDQDVEEIKRVSFLLEGKKLSVDSHDAVVFDENNYIISAMNMEKVDNIPAEYNEEGYDKANVEYIQEIEDGKLKWQFRSADHPEFYGYTMHSDNEFDRFYEDYSDYMHFNSFAIDPVDNNLLVSFRNQCSIIKINRDNGQIMWILGGKGDQFGIGDSLFACQHSISFTDEGNLLIYNNDLDPKNSSVLELRLDENNRKVEVVNSLELPVHTANYGLVYKTDKDTYLVHYGNFHDLDTMPGFYEIDAKSGKVIFSVNFDRSANSSYVYKVTY